jgi:hypothetical protein
MILKSRTFDLLWCGLKTVLLAIIIVAPSPTDLLARQRKATRHELTAQDRRLENILSRQSTFTPANNAPLEQLIEVAQHFQIPAGIEWVEDSNAVVAPLSLEANATVGELFSAIVRRVNGHRLIVKNGMVHVFSMRFSNSPANLLNLRLRHFQIRNENLFDARRKLVIAIDWTLHPAAYAGGYVGGWGNDPTHVFAIRNISFSSSHLAVREILDGLVKTYGNSLWVARLKPEKVSHPRPALRRIYQDEEALLEIWEFFPFAAN